MKAMTPVTPMAPPMIMTTMIAICPSSDNPLSPSVEFDTDTISVEVAFVGFDVDVLRVVFE